MIKKIGVACALLGFAVVLHAQSPLGVRGREWNEQDGYAIVEGVNLHYWLYSTEYFCNYHNNDMNIIGDYLHTTQIEILKPSLFQWVEREGWTIDYENALVIDPNNYLALSVKRLMISRGRDFGVTNNNSMYMNVSVTIVVDNPRRATLIINYWNFMKENYYRTYVYPLVKF